MELVAGINGKNLRIFDLRAPDKKQQQGPTTHVTRAVYGVCVDPKLDHRVASYYDNQVSSSLLLVQTLLRVSICALFRSCSGTRGASTSRS